LFYPNFYPKPLGLTMAYAERRKRQKGVRYRGIYKAADGSYRSAGTFNTEKRALEVATEAERHAMVVGGAAGGLDAGIRATRTIKDYAPLFLRHHRVEGNTKDTYADTLRLHVVPFLGGCRVAETDRTVARNYITALLEEGRSANTIRQAKVVLCAMFGMAVADGYVDYNPFHDVKIPKVPGRRAIKVATPEQYLTIRACLPTRAAQVFSTLLVSSGDPVLRGGRAAACRLRFRGGHPGSGPVGGQGVAPESPAGQDVPGARLHQERPDPQAQARPGRG
jgi:hypothetical protein